MPVSFYDNHTSSSLSSARVHARAPLLDYLQSLLTHGPKHYIDNIHTAIKAISVDDKIIPFTISHNDCESSYVASLYNQYIGYARDELPRQVTLPMRTLYDPLLFVLGELLRASKINRSLHVNNWLFSTNLTPELNQKQLGALVEALVDEYPKHAIVFRSVNAWNPDTLDCFVASGFTPLFSRQIFMLDSKTDEPFKERHMKKDVQLLQTSGYKIVHPSALTTKDAARIAELYHALNIHKHSRQNPQFNERFTGMSIQNQALRFTCLEKDGVIDAVYGCYDDGSAMVAPFFGYDTSKPESLGLYRQICAAAVLEAHEKGLLYNQSSGASEFKTRRKATPVLEYHMIFTRHLNSFRRAAWKGMCAYSNRVILPFVVKNRI